MEYRKQGWNEMHQNRNVSVKFYLVSSHLPQILLTLKWSKIYSVMIKWSQIWEGLSQNKELSLYGFVFAAGLSMPNEVQFFCECYLEFNSFFP